MPFTANDRLARLPLLALALAYFLANSISKAVADPPDSARIQVSWQEVPLAEKLQEWESLGGCAAFRDRRVDPRARINLQAEGAPSQLLDDALAPLGYGATRLSQLVYAGPQQASRRLRTLLLLNQRAASSAAPQLRQGLRSSNALAWPRLTRPRGLITSLAHAHGAPLRGSDKIPHDVWDAGRLPAMPMSDQLAILLYGFDLSWRLSDDANALEIVRVPQQIAVEKTHRALRSRQVDQAAFQLEFPHAKLERSDGAWVLEGTLEAHERLASLLRIDSIEQPIGSLQRARRLTLRVEQQPAGIVLESLAKQLGLTIAIMPSDADQVQQALRQRIDLRFVQAELGEVLTKIGDLTELAIENSDGRISIEARN